MADLLLNAHTDQQLHDFLNLPSHTLLLTGPSGSGKEAVARFLATQLLQLKIPLESYPYLSIISSQGNKAIGIAPIRELEHFLSLKVPNQNTIQRLVIIVDSHLLTHEAQNALLKTLEEPPAGTALLLTAGYSQALLTTIRSRVQQIAVKTPPYQAVLDFFTVRGHTAAAIKQAYSISGGLPGLMHAILSDSDHPMLQATQRARLLLSKSQYERLSSVDELAKNKTLALDTLFILQQMAHVSLQTLSGTSADTWQRVLATSYAAQSELATNTQPKLVLTHLMLSL